MSEIKVIKSTACLVLMGDDKKNYLDYQFINKFQFDNFMTITDIKEAAHQFALKNSISEYLLNLEEVL